MYAQGKHKDAFLRQLWKHTHNLSETRAVVCSEVIEKILHLTNVRTDTELVELHVQNSLVDDWMCFAATFEDACRYLEFYSQQQKSVRPDRPRKVVEIVTRAWHSAVDCMQQAVSDLETSVCKSGSFVSTVSSEAIQTIHNAACQRATAYARVAQNLYQNTAGFYTELRMVQKLADLQCEEAISSVMEHLATIAENQLKLYGTAPTPVEPEPMYETIQSDASDLFEQMVSFRKNEALYAADKPRADLWHTIYRTQIQWLPHKLKGTPLIHFEFDPVIELLTACAKNYKPHHDQKTINFLLQSVDLYLCGVNGRSHKDWCRADVSEFYFLAAEAQNLLSEMTLEDYDVAENEFITIARMRVDRYHCAALSYLETINNPREDTREKIANGSLVGRIRVMLSRKDIDEKYTSNTSTFRSLLAWENAVAVEVFEKRVPQPAYVYAPLQSYGFVLLKHQLLQIDPFVNASREGYPSRHALRNAEQRHDDVSMNWWKCAIKALNALCSTIYAHCFESGTAETISQSRVVFDAIKLCAVAHDNGKTLHSACSELATLALAKYKRLDNSLDKVALKEHNKLCEKYAQFLQVAAEGDTELTELVLVAVDCQKRIVRECRVQQFYFPAQCLLAAADARVSAYISRTKGNFDAEQLYNEARALFVEAEELFTSNVSSTTLPKYRNRARNKYSEGESLCAQAEALQIG